MTRHPHTSKGKTATQLRFLLSATGWRRLIGSFKSQIIFHKGATQYRSLLRKMTCKDKRSYESWPPCTLRLLAPFSHPDLTFGLQDYQTPIEKRRYAAGHTIGDGRMHRRLQQRAQGAAQGQQQSTVACPNVLPPRPSWCSDPPSKRRWRRRWRWRWRWRRRWRRRRGYAWWV